MGTIKADSLTAIAPVMTFNDLLQGRAPGVLSVLDGGMSGRSGRIRLRGLNSISASNDPIIIVDGVRVETGASLSGAAGIIGDIAGANGGAGRLSDNPNEIEAVEVVKGPSAATLYGTDAANGVIVITTKRGQARWSVFTEQGILQQRLDLEDLIPDPYYSFGRNTQTSAPMRCTLRLQAVGTSAADSLASFNAATHPETRPLKNGYRQRYGIKVSGGTAEGATYFLSGDFQRETVTVAMPEIDQALVYCRQSA